MPTIVSSSSGYVPSTSELHTATTMTTDYSGMDASYKTSTVMDNNTHVNVTFFPVTEDHSGLFGDMNRAEEVVIWASISVGILAVIAVILRLLMPVVRRIYRQRREAGKLKHTVHGSSSQLLETNSPSSSSRASTTSACSRLELWKPDDKQAGVTTISDGLLPHPKHSAFGSLSTEVMSAPVYLPKLKLVSSQVDISSQESLNKELTSVLSTPVLQRLTSLNFNAHYRENWNKGTRVNSSPSDSSGQVSHSAESERLRVPVLIHQSSPGFEDLLERAPVLIYQSSSRLGERVESKDEKITTPF